MAHNYSAQVAWSLEDECYVATIPEFPGLSGLGENQQDAVSEVQTALELAVASMEADSLQLPEPYTVIDYSGKFVIRLPKSLHRDLAESAYRERVSLNQYATALLSRRNAITTLKDEILREMRTIVYDAHYVWVSLQQRMDTSYHMFAGAQQLYSFGIESQSTPTLYSSASGGQRG